MIRVLVVDDLAFMRIAIRRMIEADPTLKVVGEARNGKEAVALARRFNPDVITMDIEMPEMNGLDATSTILEQSGDAPPPAIVMVSATTQLGAADTIEALRRGAVDFVSKSSIFTGTDLAHIEGELLRIIRALGQRREAPPAPRPREPAVTPSKRTPDLIVIGASTGGPQALYVLLRAMGRLRVPVVIAQHMPRVFTTSLAAMLTTELKLDVREAVANEVLAPGAIRVIPGGNHGAIVRGVAGFRVRLAPAPNEIAPSVDQLFSSAARAASAPLGVVLTGMGRDGAAGAGELAERGAQVLVQSPNECVVAGMPEAAIDAGVATRVLPLAELGAWIASAARETA